MPDLELCHELQSAVREAADQDEAYVSETEAYQLRILVRSSWPGLCSWWSVDGLIYASSMVMLDSARRKVSVPALASWLLGLGIAATLAANVAHGLGHGLTGATVAAWPAVALVGSYELLMMIIRSAQGPTGADVRGASYGAPDDDPLQARAAEAFAGEVAAGQGALGARDPCPAAHRAARGAAGTRIRGRPRRRLETSRLPRGGGGVRADRGAVAAGAAAVKGAQPERRVRRDRAEIARRHRDGVGGVDPAARGPAELAAGATPRATPASRRPPAPPTAGSASCSQRRSGGGRRPGRSTPPPTRRNSGAAAVDNPGIRRPAGTGRRRRRAGARQRPGRAHATMPGRSAGRPGAPPSTAASAEARGTAFSARTGHNARRPNTPAAQRKSGAAPSRQARADP